MPLLNSVNLPTPKSWDEFENIIYSIYQVKNPYTHIERYARQGQSQDGIDIYIQNQNNTVIQCKNYNSLTINNIDNIVKKVTFNPHGEIIIAVALKRDKTLQDYVRNNYSNQNVSIYFWDDIELDLGNTGLIQTFYPQFFIQESNNPNSLIIPRKSVNKCITGFKFFSYLGWDTDVESSAFNCSLINQILVSLSNLSPNCLVIFSKMLEIAEYRNNNSPIVPINELEHKVYNPQALPGYLDELTKYGITSDVDSEEDRFSPVVYIYSCNSEAYSFWELIKNYCFQFGYSLENCIRNLDFSILD